jgi:MurNAc alpha-1-phosphate uridylyltransferase
MSDPVIAAMLLAAGRGERMRPLTDTTPKPLLTVHGKPLMQWPLEALARGGFGPVVINTAWLGEQIAATFGDVFALQPPSNGPSVLSHQEQSVHRIELRYSHEGRDFGGALETAGGIARALPMLGDVFWVLAGDVFAPDFVFERSAANQFMASDRLAHLWLVPNPEHHPKGDFGLAPLPGVAGAATADGHCGLALNLDAADPRPRYTYSTIGLFRSALFEAPWCGIPPGNPQGVRAPLAALLRSAMDQGRVSAELYTGAWTDVGTPQRLAQLNADMAGHAPD